MAFTVDDEHYRYFGRSLERVIARYGDLEESERADRQRERIEALVGLEQEFREALIEDRRGEEAYQRFISYICEIRRNILVARPFFRERQGIFRQEISGALKNRDVAALQKFRFNYLFVAFIVRAGLPNGAHWGQRSKVTVLARKIARIRNEIVEINLPLAIFKARKFWSRTPQSHLSFMDLVQICAEGLMAAVDKFVLPYRPVFASVALGRMVGNLIEEYSETLLHFFPVDKRRLYRANKVIGKFHQQFAEVDFESLAAEVNAKAKEKEAAAAAADPDAKPKKPDEPVSAAALADLMAASSCVSAERDAESDDAGSGRAEGITAGIERFPADSSTQPDVMFEDRQARGAVYHCLRKLSIAERKVLRLDGVSL